MWFRGCCCGNIFDSTNESKRQTTFEIHRGNSENYASIDLVNTVAVTCTYKCLPLEINALAQAHAHRNIWREKFKHRMLSWNITS